MISPSPNSTAIVLPFAVTGLGCAASCSGKNTAFSTENGTSVSLPSSRRTRTNSCEASIGSSDTRSVRPSRYRRTTCSIGFNSEELDPPEIVEVNDTFDAALAIDDEEGSDLLRLHHLQRRRRQLVRLDRERVFFHRLAGRLAHDLVVLLQQPPEVAIGDRAGEPSLGIGDRGDPKAFVGHLIDRVVHERLFIDDRDVRAAMHEVSHAQKPLSELPTRMEERE